MAMVPIKAKRFWTGNVKGGAILHLNPEGSDPTARATFVDEADVPRLIDEDVIHMPKGWGKSATVTEASVADAAAAKVSDRTKDLDDDAGTLSDDTVAHSDPSPAGENIDVVDEDDAPPPAPSKPKPSGR